MLYLILKYGLTALIIVVASEIAKRNDRIGALIISLPLTSILAMCWLYWDERDPAKIGTLSHQILWLVLASLPFFIILPFLLKRGLGFTVSLLITCGITTLLYAGALMLGGVRGET